MFLVRSKVKQIFAFQSEGRNLVTDCFFRVRCRFSDRDPYFFQDFLNIIWEGRDIPINVFGRCLISSHLISFAKP